MNIKLLNSWIADYLESPISPQKFAESMSLSSISIERIEPFETDHGKDFIYDIEITTNRPDLASVVGIAREAGAILPEYGIKAKFTPPKFAEVENRNKLIPTNSIRAGSRTEATVGNIDIQVDAELVNRICAVVLEFDTGPSPKSIQERLITSGINPHNNVIDVTNYVMRELGHPMHAFDYDKIKSKKMIVRKSKNSEKITTLDGNTYELPGNDIVIDDGAGNIIDLMGIKGTLNSAIDDNSSRVLLFVDNNNPHLIRESSMSLGIRTDAAQLNEKGLDPELAKNALLRGVALLQEFANAKVISEFVDIYPNKPKPVSIEIHEEKINSVMGIELPIIKSAKILENLGFDVVKENLKLKVSVPSFRLGDVAIEEDLIEEIARVYGYHKLPNLLPVFETSTPYNMSRDQFFWEQKIKETLKFLGFTEIYTYSLISEDLLEISPNDAVTLKNPLDEEHKYLRTTLVPSLLSAIKENKLRENVSLFELANVYIKNGQDLPTEKLMLAGVRRQSKVSFLNFKGKIVALFAELGIKDVEFKKAKSGAQGADIYISKSFIGQIELLDEDLIDFEFDFSTILKYTNIKKIYKPISRFPESTEDLRFEIDETIEYVKIENKILEVSTLIKKVSLLDVYKNKKTFRIVYQSNDRNITNEELSELRDKIMTTLKESFKATPA